MGGAGRACLVRTEGKKPFGIWASYYCNVYNIMIKTKGPQLRIHIVTIPTCSRDAPWIAWIKGTILSDPFRNEVSRFPFATRGFVTENQKLLESFV